METPKTKEEREALFAQLFANMAPSDPKEPSIMAQLEPYREQLAQKREQGYSLRQISIAVKQEPLRMNVSAVTLMRFLGERRRHRKTKKASPTLRLVNPAEPVEGGICMQ
jgi:hypothetical protein